LLRDFFETDCHVYLTFNGTAANSLAIAALCQPYHSVIAHQQSHVETDECGGPGFFSPGTKLQLVGGDQGRIDMQQVDAIVNRRRDLHCSKPKAISITQATEMGTVYDVDSLDRVHESAQRLDLNLHMDGARLANALATLERTPKEVTWQRGVDVLCLGGTKNGMAVGDCVIFFDRALAQEFEYRCKQAGQLASKMRYLAAPWVGMLSTGTWLQNARHANAMAQRLGRFLQDLPGVTIAAPIQANAVFVRFPDGVAAKLRQSGWSFHDLFHAGTARLMCSWATTTNEVDHFVGEVREHLTQNQAGSQSGLPPIG
jgi:threonine aldolase